LEARGGALSCQRMLAFLLLPPPRRLRFRRCLSVCLLATLRRNLQTDLQEIFREGWQWANEQKQMIKFSWQSGSEIRIRIATLVKRALTELCTISASSSYSYHSI